MASIMAVTGASLGSASCSLMTGYEKLSNQSTYHIPAVASRAAGPVHISAESQKENINGKINVGRREMALAGLAVTLFVSASPEPVQAAEFLEIYKAETSHVIDQVRSTVQLDKNDPDKGNKVAALRELSNEWVAKYRREKAVAGKPSFSNMYSALNAISGHYISFGPGYPFPKKRADRILEEVADAEKALNRGR